MSNDKDRSNSTWDDEDAMKPPSTFRDSYLNALNQNRARSGDTSQDDLPETPNSRARPRNTPGGRRIYEESDERPSRPRPTRQSREEVEARLRQRPRQSAREQDDARVQPPAQAKRPSQVPPRGEQEEARFQPPNRAKRQDRATPYEEQNDAYPYHQSPPIRTPRASRGAVPANPNRAGRQASAQYEEYDEYEVGQGRGRQPTGYRQGKRRRGGNTFRTILVGCVSSLLTLTVIVAIIAFFALRDTPLGQNLGLSKSNYTQSGTQAITLGSATQLIIKNQTGNVSVSVDQSATGATLASVKKVQAGSTSDANSQFSQIKLSVKPISQDTDPVCTASNCLLITTTVPTTAGSVLGSSNGDTIDLNITLPSSFSSPVSPYTLAVNANAGNITVNNFNGILNLNSTAGNISVARNAVIFAGTCIQTLHGNITIGQGSSFDLATPSQAVPCNGTTSDQTHPWFNINTGVGDIAITLATNSTDLLLDANTNVGKITDQFGRTIPTASDGSATYYGPLLPNTNPTALLHVATSTGNIAINKQ